MKYMGNFIKKLYLCLLVMGVSLTAALFVSATTAYAADYYVSTKGSDGNFGTLDSPFASITKAQSEASAGDIVYIMGGTYKNFKIANSDKAYNYVHDITKSGITYQAYSTSDMPTFDFSNITTSKRVAAFHIASGVKDVTFLGINVTGVPVGTQKQSECFRVEGNVTLNQVTCHDNAANGFYFVNHATGTCIRCDSYNNIGVKGISLGNTDGFGAHAEGVTFKECRAWNCSDDGYDCLTSTGANTFDNCWAYNMNAGGDSNGFKIGGYAMGIPPSVAPVHTVKNCLSANNGAHGFYSNHQPGQAAVWTNNTAYNNKFGNFDMLERVSTSDNSDIPGTREILHNNISFTGVDLKEANLPSENVTNNSWNKKGVSVSAEDFQSLDASQMIKPRGKDGELPNITFMQLNSNSDLKGLGCFQSGSNTGTDPTQPTQPTQPTSTVTNIAKQATSDTSYLSDWASISALNDGIDPSNSNDVNAGVYANYPKVGTQSVQYVFSKNFTISSCDVYWYDNGEGMQVPASYRIVYWDGTAWQDVKNPKGLGTKTNQYNTTTFTPVSTNAIAIQMISKETSATGIIEWKVYGK